MQRFAMVLAGVMAVSMLLTAACSGGTAGTDSAAAAPAPTAAPGTQAVTLTVGNGMSFSPSSLDVQAGQPVQVTLQNNGQMPHDFTLSEGVSQPVKITATGGQTASGTFTINTPGTYSFDCSMPGHASAGMRGTITVQ